MCLRNFSIELAGTIKRSDCHEWCESFGDIVPTLWYELRIQMVYAIILYIVDCENDHGVWCGHTTCPATVDVSALCHSFIERWEGRASERISQRKFSLPAVNKSGLSRPIYYYQCLRSLTRSKWQTTASMYVCTFFHLHIAMCIYVSVL